jgi:HSP20 family molecular chaperone IbpA
MDSAARLRAIVSLAHDLDEFFEQFMGGSELPPVWSPPVDLFLSDRRVHLTVEIPGVNPQDMEIRIGPRLLVVRGYKPAPADARHGVSFYESEIPYGPFEKRVALPVTVLPESYRVELASGVLAIELERASSVPRVVKIE